MKSRIMSLVVAASLVVASCGTTYESTSDNAAYNVTVPANIRSDFAAQYPDAVNVTWNNYDVNTVPIDWEMTGWQTLDTDDYAVTFDLGTTRYYAWYDANGTLVGSSYQLSDVSKLPHAVATMLNDKYKDYTVASVDREMWGSQTAWEIKLKQGDETKLKLLVDSNGTVLKEKMKD